MLPWNLYLKLNLNAILFYFAFKFKVIRIHYTFPLTKYTMNQNLHLDNFCNYGLYIYMTSNAEEIISKMLSLIYFYNNYLILKLFS